MSVSLLALAGLQSAFSTVVSMKGKGDEAEAQNKLYKQNADSAITGQAHENKGINARIDQEQVVAAQQKKDLLIQMISAKSTRQARGSGIGGNSVDRLSQSINNKVGSAIDDINFNLSGALFNADMKKTAVTSQTQSRINRVPRSGYAPALDFVTGGLNIVSSVMSAGQGQ
mgnify:CR=1 FL=1